MSKLFADASCISITAFISPYRSDRAFVRRIHEEAGIPFVEVFVDAPLHVVEQRDPKGLYKKARAGEIKGAELVAVGFADHWTEFTGISAPYQAPEQPEIRICTDTTDVTESVRIIADYLAQSRYIT